MIVVDSNVLAYLYLPGERTARADALLERDAGRCASIRFSRFRARPKA
jgi:predicted nucleic acid-binding protein